MIEKIREFVREKELIREGDRIAAGFSGGADSLCLLLVLRELQRDCDFWFCAVHVEHGIRGEESLRDAQFARAFCERYGISFFLYTVDAPARAAENGESLEEAARILRYECFAKACEESGCNKIATAHHAGDHAETVLFHMCRGTGAAGMCGIRPQRDIVIRPLLCAARGEIEAFLAERGEAYCLDSTNEDLSASRNRIRSCVIPQLEKVHPGAEGHIRMLSDTMEEICDFLSKETERQTEGLVREEGEREFFIEKNGFKDLHPALQKHLIHTLVCRAAGGGKDIAAVHVKQILALFDARTGARLDLPRGLSAQSGCGEVRIGQKKEETGTACREVFELKAGIPVTLPDGAHVSSRLIESGTNLEEIPRGMCTKWFDYDKIEQIVCIRTRRSGDYLTVTAQGGKKKLKNWLIDEKIPAEKRDSLWLLADGSHILWVAGYRISEYYKVSAGTGRILEVNIHY